MTLWAYPMDATGCGSYRISWPLEALAEHRGLDWHCVPPGSDEGFSARLSAAHQITHVLIPEGCTGLLIQRPTSELLIETLTALKRSTDLPLLVDVDDDLSALSPRHPAFHHLHPRSTSRMPGHSAQAVHAACDLADVVICSTPALLERYAKRGQGVVLENRLPRHLVPAEGSVADTPPHPNASSEAGGGGGRDAPSHTEPRVGRVGWPGSIITHPDDLAPVLPALRRLQVDPFICFGPSPHPYRPPYPAMTFTGPIEFADWIPAIADTLDIGVAPLAPTTFNAAKSWLKPLELAAALTPAVISNTVEYATLDSGHLHASNPKEWHAQLRRLISDPDLRHSIRLKLRATARRHTYDAPHVLDDWSAVFAPWLPTVTAGVHSAALTD